MFIGITDWSGAFFLNKNKTKKKKEKIKTRGKHQIGTVLSRCSQSDPKSWQHPRAGAKGTWDHEAAPPWMRMERWDRGRDVSDVDCTTHVQLLLMVFYYFVIILFLAFFPFKKISCINKCSKFVKASGVLS